MKTAPVQRNVITIDGKKRCGWSLNSPLEIEYHDREWGVPVHDDRMLFEFLILEGAQAGLSWVTILKKRPAYREAFDRFDPAVVAGYVEEKIGELLINSGIVRNRRKVEAAVANARAFVRVQDEYGSFDAYIWGFVDGVVVRNSWTHERDIPTRTKESEAMSKDLKRRGFRFVGPTVCCAFMQAVGIVNDHIIDCFRHREIMAMDRSFTRS